MAVVYDYALGKEQGAREEREAILDVVRQWNCGMLKCVTLYDAIESRGEQKPVKIGHVVSGDNYDIQARLNTVIDAVNALMEKQT